MHCARGCNCVLAAQRMVSVNQARSFLAICGILPICCAALLVAHTGSAAAGNLKPESNSKAVAITVDDLPGAVPARGSWAAVGDLKDLQGINRAITQILKSHHAPAIGFVNEWKLQVSGERDARVELLQWWLDAGLTLGNHTYTHASLQTTPLDQYEDETIRGEVVTRALMKAAGQEEKYFRHPFLMTGPNGSLRCRATFGGRNRSTEQARGLICGPFHGIRRETLGTDFGNEEEKLPHGRVAYPG